MKPIEQHLWLRCPTVSGLLTQDINIIQVQISMQGWGARTWDGYRAHASVQHSPWANPNLCLPTLNCLWDGFAKKALPRPLHKTYATLSDLRSPGSNFKPAAEDQS